MNRSSEHRVKNMQSTFKLTEEQLDEFGIIHPGMANHALLNTYRDIRNKLLKLSDYNNFVCLVTALSPGQDSSLLAMNLASVFAFDKSRSALVVDCCADADYIDKLIPEAHTRTGLIDFIEDEEEDMSKILCECGIDRVRIIPTGSLTETRTEIMESTRMREIILELKRHYSDRYIFINAPNVKASSEVQVLSNISDMVLFELDAGTVTPRDVTEMVETIGAEKVAGVLFRKY